MWYEGGVREQGEKFRLEILPFLLVAQDKYDAELNTACNSAMGTIDFPHTVFSSGL